MATNWDQYRVTGLDQSSEFSGELFDSILYPTAGAPGNQLQFFQSPIGQGLTSALGAVAGTTKTQADTNMQLGGMLSSGMQFLAHGLEIIIVPGASAAANTFTLQTPGEFNAAAAATVDGGVNDIATLAEAGVVTFKVLDKEVWRGQGMRSCPPRRFLGLGAAVASNSATVGALTIATARVQGELNVFQEPVLLDPGMNFGVYVDFPGLVPTPSGFNARIVAKLFGLVRRSVQ